MSPEKFNRIVIECWESIAFVAYEGYLNKGRGVVVLMEEQSTLEQSYVPYRADNADTRTAKLIAEYDPAWEVLVQYRRPDLATITLRIRTRPDQRHPWRIWTANGSWEGGLNLD